MINKKAKELLKVLKKDGIISEGEYQRIWNDYKHLHKISKPRKMKDERYPLIEFDEILLNDKKEIIENICRKNIKNEK